MSTAAQDRQIILAEDNPADVFLVREALRQQNLESGLRVIADGDEVLRYIDLLDSDSTVTRPELLLLDMHLPRRDGEEILRHLRSSECCGQTPVIVMTSSTSPAGKKTAETHAAMHYFQKPSDFAEYMTLGRLVKSILSPVSARTQGIGTASPDR